MSQLFKAVLPAALLMATGIAHSDEGNFKRWAVSAGWLHVMPQGKANNMNINTAVDSEKSYAVGNIESKEILNAPNIKETIASKSPAIQNIINGLLQKDVVPGALAGKAKVDGITSWTDNAGLEADDVDTLGLTFSYFPHENVSIELVGGIPPKVDIEGKGQIIAKADAESTWGHLKGLQLKKDILISDLSGHGKVAEVTAWTPTLTAKYHFGKSGINKLRPFVGAGIVYGHFNKLKLDGGVERDLINAGHMVQNIISDDSKNGGSGQALANSGKSSANPVVKVKTDDAFAPVVTAGFSYDLTDRWFTTASLTYMPNFNNTATITVTDSNTGNQLIKATTKVDLDPLITYVGVGFRF